MDRRSDGIVSRPGNLPTLDKPAPDRGNQGVRVATVRKVSRRLSCIAVSALRRTVSDVGRWDGALELGRYAWDGTAGMIRTYG
jgi:hypothetical protein